MIWRFLAPLNPFKVNLIILFLTDLTITQLLSVGLATAVLTSAEGSRMPVESIVWSDSTKVGFRTSSSPVSSAWKHNTQAPVPDLRLELFIKANTCLQTKVVPAYSVKCSVLVSLCFPSYDIRPFLQASVTNPMESQQQQQKRFKKTR